MTKETMPKPETGVYRIARSTSWQWRIKVPKDLRHEYPSEWAHRTSLKTSDLRVANTTAATLRSEWLAHFERQRQGQTLTAIETFTPELAKTLAAHRIHLSLKGDERRRFDPTVYGPIAADLKRLGVLPETTPEVNPMGLDGVPAELNDWYAAMHTENAQARADSMARGRLADTLEDAKYLAEKQGLRFEDDTPGLRDALIELLKASRLVDDLKRRRDLGEVVDTPPAPALASLPVSRPASMSMREVFGKWKNADVRGSDAVNSCDRALKLFEESLGNAVPPVADITRAHGSDFKGWLVAKINANEMSSKTAHDRLTSVKGLLRFACEELEVIAKHPWRSLDIKYKTENPRRPWTHDQLKAMAALPLFGAYELPTGTWRAGGAAAYWVPLLGLYTGATVSELCQLQTNDVELAADGSGLLHITEDGEDQQLKNFEHRRRVIPIHSELVRLGFLEYVKATKAGQLWPEMRFREGKPGGYFSDWFGKLRKPSTGVELFPDFHSIRHTVRSKLSAAGVDVSVQDKLTGHTVLGSAGTRVYTHTETPQLRQAIETINYPGLDLPAVYLSKHPKGA